MRTAAASLSLVWVWLLTGCASWTMADGEGMPASTVRAPGSVRVRILNTRQPATLSATGPYVFQSTRGSKRFTASSALTVRAGASSLGVGNKSFRGDVVVRPAAEGSVLKINGRRYRGSLRLHREGRGTLEIVEELPLEAYLYGVLPKEVGAQWPLEALKAQAVISRTYAAANLTLNAGARYDVVNTVSDQVYGGMDSEDPAATQAIESTRGEILRDPDGTPLQTFFHASCGGQTDLPDAVWPGRTRSSSFGRVADPYCNNYPRQQWSMSMSWSTLYKRLRRGGINVRNVKAVSVEKKTPTGRAEIIGIRTSRGLVPVGANRFRLAVGPESLRSVYLTGIDHGRNQVTFRGLGWGHGVGLCQWGARGRALAGQDYRQILQTYYPGAVFSSLNPS